MKGLKDTLSQLAGLRKRFERLVSLAAKGGPPSPSTVDARLEEVSAFGTNPGSLRMFVHVPRNLPKAPALVVAMHGCTQTAATYDHGSGWSRLADDLGFAVLFPEQQRANNPNNCFNWFLASDTRRHQGEAHSIQQMIERMIRDHSIDRRRIFIVGLSAGGAMAAAMLANYPEVFAGGAIVAGLPYGAATNVQTAFEAMAHGGLRSSREWGDLVRSASTHAGPWPKISIWHGTADAIVNPINMEHTLSQWVNVHGADAMADFEDKVKGHSRRVWQQAGEEIIEAISINGMGHGVPLATAGSGTYGNVSPFHFDVGISSSLHILKFWDLAKDDIDSAYDPLQSRGPGVALACDAPLLAARTGPPSDTIPKDRADRGGQGVGGWASAAASADPSIVITAALKAAGLVRSDNLGNRVDTKPLDPRGIIASTLRSVGLLKE
jgi:poly(hydroxyalkanoate) depolymerase family esterase